MIYQYVFKEAATTEYSSSILPKVTVAGSSICDAIFANQLKSAYSSIFCDLANDSLGTTAFSK